MLTHKRLLTAALLPFLFLLLSVPDAAAQVPDTTYRKPELPTGPPVPVEQPRPQQRPRVQEQPKPQPQPTVVEPEPVTVQETEEIPLRFIDKLYFGGSFGLQFGTFTSISLLPTLSYAVTPKFFVGLGGVYHYESGGGYNLHHYGGRGFTQLEIIDVGSGTILAHAEVETLSVQSPIPSFNGRQTDRSGITMPMGGLGYRQRFSNKGSFDLLVLYNGNEEPNNPYSNPVIRVGFNIPFTSR